MEKSSVTYQTYVRILKRELVPAMGCTEPIAIAFCAAKARAVLGQLPDRIHIEASGNIIKNVKSVIVPNTDGRSGIAAAAAIGVLGGDEEALLEVISRVPDSVRAALGDYLNKTEITVTPAESDCLLDITVHVYAGDASAAVRVANEHTNLVYIGKDGKVLLEKEVVEQTEEDVPDYDLLNVNDILEFASVCDLDDVRDTLRRQIEMNTAISDEGLKHNYGANIGKVLLSAYGGDVRNRAKARAAAGSDARMNGCELPVVINSGSGNQGITASVPVIEYARELNCGEDTLYRALIISNLVTLQEKNGIGRLSAYCGAVSAGAGTGAGIAYLCGGGKDEIAHTIVNALAITSGIVCDGAKSSCAAKIAAAVDAGILGYEMYRQGQQFYAGDGLVLKGVDNTIRNFGRLGKVGMRETDREIIRMMTETC
ncbi:MAG: L-serine ammonia-lyase, iron-sulfur-dependent, subunit alpha [Oscillospiraceae bacterium]|nr:L-serine ammonia-lyase, iron-sulfur-dependent, subunit alpha [Oscillospiraceae bacterium]